MAITQEQLDALKAKAKALEEQEAALAIEFGRMEAERDKYLQELDAKIAPKREEFQNAQALYRAEMKALLGVCDGEKTSLLGVVDLVKRLV